MLGNLYEEEASAACRHLARQHGLPAVLPQGTCFTLTLDMGHWQTRSLPWASLPLSSASTGSQGQRGQEEMDEEYGRWPGPCPCTAGPLSP